PLRGFQRLSRNGALWSGIRTRDKMIHSHLLYPTELSTMMKLTGFEPATSGLRRRSHLTELQPLPRSAEHGHRRADRASRDKSPDTRPNEGARLWLNSISAARGFATRIQNSNEVSGKNIAREISEMSARGRARIFLRGTRLRRLL